MIIPSLTLSNGRAVSGGATLAQDFAELALKASIVGEFVVNVVEPDNEANKSVLTTVIKSTGSCQVTVSDTPSALFWLNLGATKVILDPSTPTSSLTETLTTLPKARLVVNVGHISTSLERITALKDTASEFLVTLEGDLNAHLDSVKQLVTHVGKHHLTIAGCTVSDVLTLDKLGIDAQLDMHTNDIAVALTSLLVTDRPDGLFTTMVVDEQGVALGLVYSSTESIKEAISLQRGVYYSRSRKSIWYKGDTSGDTQRLVKIEIDCDRDALKFVVTQSGDGFCHLKTRSCFSKNDTGLGGLMRTLEARKKEAPEGSYTKRLFEDSNLLRAKLVEEAHELADAKTHEEVVGETADVIYFALVAAAKAGVSLKEVELELDRRSLKVQRRPGNAKPHIVNLLQKQDEQKLASSSTPHVISQPITTPPAPSQVTVATPEKPLHIDPAGNPKALVKLALPKGRMEQGVFKLINDAGLALKVESRGYRPTIAVPGFDVKLLKPQNIVEMVNLGQRDIGFTGADLVEELGAKNVTMILDTQLDKVKIVAAAPEDILDAKGEVLASVTSARKLVVASEYKNIAQRWMGKRGLSQENSVFVLSRGATEVFPPEDADIIVDNTATGSTLKANRLRAFDELLHSTTCLYVNSNLWNGTDAVSIAKKQAIQTLVVLLKSVIDAQRKVILEFNIEKQRLEDVCKFIPAMREPTISQLHGAQSFAVKSVVPREELFNLIPLIKSHGGGDIIVTDLHHVVA